MSGRGVADAEAHAARVLELVRERAATAEAEVNVRTGTLALTRFANSVIHQNVAEELHAVALRVALDGRVAGAQLDGPAGEDELRALVDGVFEAARVSPVDADWPGVTAPAAVDPVEHWDEATADATPDDRASIVERFVGAAGGLVTAGAMSTQGVVAAFADSAGHAVARRASVATLDGIARTPTSDGVARRSSVRLGDIDGAAAGEHAARKARDAAQPGDLEPGRYEVVLEPSCVHDIISFLVVYGYGGRPVVEGRSFMRPGEEQLDPALTLRQDVRAAGMSGLPFDGEGTPRAAVDIIRAGVSSGVLHDRRSARRAGRGAASTGNGAIGPNPWGAVPAALVLEPGSGDTATLVASMERGLLVTDFWYTRILDPKTLVVTGLTRNGVWLVEDGRVVRPVRNLRFTQAYAAALAPGNVKGVGADVALFPGGVDDALLVPSLHLAAWTFTGGAKG